MGKQTGPGSPVCRGAGRLRSEAHRLGLESLTTCRKPDAPLAARRVERWVRQHYGGMCSRLAGT